MSLGFILKEEEAGFFYPFGVWVFFSCFLLCFGSGFGGISTPMTGFELFFRPGSCCAANPFDSLVKNVGFHEGRAVGTPVRVIEPFSRQQIFLTDRQSLLSLNRSAYSFFNDLG
jgi:hypothetical protein